MKNILTYSLFIIFLSLFTQAQQNTLLYSIKSKGTKTSYIFGTVHMIADTAYYFPAKLDKLLGKSDVLVLEIDNISDQAKAKQLLLLDSGTVFDIFTQVQADSVVAWGSKLLGMKPDLFRKSFGQMKPFVLMQIGIQAQMNARSRSYEMELMSKARENRLPVKGLESMEYQFGLFENIPDSSLVNMIMEGIRHPEDADEMQRDLTRLYMNKDTEGLAQLIESSEGIHGTAETLLYQRNSNWIPVMTNFMQNESCFFAVGAGHLGGEKGVLQLLKNAGYTITPVHY